MLDDRMHLAVLQLTVVFDAVFGALHDRRDDPGRLTFAHDVVTPAWARPTPHDGVELVLICHACFVRRELRIERETWLPHDRTERLEMFLRLARDEHPPVLPVAVAARAAI